MRLGLREDELDRRLEHDPGRDPHERAAVLERGRQAGEFVLDDPFIERRDRGAVTRIADGVDEREDDDARIARRAAGCGQRGRPAVDESVGAGRDGEPIGGVAQLLEAQRAVVVAPAARRTPAGDGQRRVARQRRAPFVGADDAAAALADVLQQRDRRLEPVGGRRERDAGRRLGDARHQRTRPRRGRRRTRRARSARPARGRPSSRSVRRSKCARRRRGCAGGSAGSA